MKLNAQLNWRQVAVFAVLGAILALMFMEIGLRGAAWWVWHAQQARNMEQAGNTGVVRVLCLGESTTQGQYTRFLEDALNRPGAQHRYAVIDAGRARTNTGLLLQGLPALLDQYRPQIVVAMAGINDGGARMVLKERGIVDASHLIRFFYLLWHRTDWAGNNAVPYLPSTTPAEPALNVSDEEARVENEARAAAAGSDAEGQLSALIVVHPTYALPYIVLSEWYCNFGRLQESGRVLAEMKKKVKGLNSRLAAARHMVLAGDSNEALAWLDATHAPDNDYRAFFWRGKALMRLQRWNEASRQFAQARSLEKGSSSLDLAAAECSLQRGQRVEAEGILKEAVIRWPDNERLVGSLAALYIETGRTHQAAELGSSDANRRTLCSSVTFATYRNIVSMVRRRGLLMVCMQYPMRPVAPLRHMLADMDGVVFVDNEALFAETVTREGFASVFVDRFAGDFGHCTDKGNQMIAKTLADAIHAAVEGK